MLCAQHALNSLLQGNYFSAPDLSEIARSLDAMEEGVRDESTADSSTNMDDTGFFSVQVLEKALQVWGLTLVRWRSEEMKPYQDHPHTQMAFILNCSQHWYTLRRFGRVLPDPAADPGEGQWFNLNSSLPEPEWVSKLYLGMVLHQAEAEGYSVFAVIQIDPSAPLALPRTEADELAMSIPDSATGPFSGPSASTVPGMEAFEGLEDEDMELQAALQASLMGGDDIPYPLSSRFTQPSSLTPPPPPIPQPQPAPSRSFSIPIRSSTSESSSRVRTPIRRPRYGFNIFGEPDEELDEDDDDDIVMPPPPAPVSIPIQERAPEPMDAIEASRRRNQALMEAFTRQQQHAMRETYEEEQARIDAGLPARRRTRQEEEDEELRRAIEESRALHAAQSKTVDDEGEDMDDGDYVPSPRRTPPAPAAAATYQTHRVYDDDDAELQAALKASLETVPEGFRIPSTPPPPQPRPPSLAPAATLSAPPAATTKVESAAEADTETESEADTSSIAEAEEVLDVDEMRRRRLARFGGS
ncbi:unnamed protein product [Somion occarium]